MSVDVMFKTRANPWRKARRVNQTSPAFVSKIPVAADPFITAGSLASQNGDAGTATGASIVRLTDDTVGGTAQNGAEVLFYGVGADNTTMSCRIIGWSCLQTSGLSPVVPETNLWIPVVLAEVLITLAAPVGLANKAIVATERFADTITIVGTTANAGIDVNVTSPANDTIARMFVDLWGHQELEFSFSTGSSATSCNALYRLL
jgi:hypothetical protein